MSNTLGLWKATAAESCHVKWIRGEAMSALTATVFTPGRMRYRIITYTMALGKH